MERATFTNAGNTVRALLVFNDAAEHRLTGGGDGVWDAPGGSYPYIRFEVVDVEYSVD
ncbi:MAG TPA: hypothetical protein VIK25_07355 [Gemmatimonadaceae bacterium]